MENIPGIRKIELEEEALKDLDTTRKWSMFLAILGFILIGILVIGSVIAGVNLSKAISRSGGVLGMKEILVSLSILVFAVIYFFPVFNLYRFSKYTSNAVKSLDKQEIQKAFKCLRKYYVYIGILAIIALVVYTILLIVVGVSGLI
ncbi:MAG: hypothetical protein NTZ85_15400 [Bacteroidia bacterium]|jgi:t-SNARE complex subunit (syntaxin)|nr:hypothetical protein [Bacteroidia bacterium]